MIKKGGPSDILYEVGYGAIHAAAMLGYDDVSNKGSFFYECVLATISWHFVKNLF